MSPYRLPIGLHFYTYCHEAMDLGRRLERNNDVGCRPRVDVDSYFCRIPMSTNVHAGRDGIVPCRYAIEAEPSIAARHDIRHAASEQRYVRACHVAACYHESRERAPRFYMLPSINRYAH